MLKYCFQTCLQSIIHLKNNIFHLHAYHSHLSRPHTSHCLNIESIPFHWLFHSTNSIISQYPPCRSAFLIHAESLQPRIQHNLTFLIQNSTHRILQKHYSPFALCTCLRLDNWLYIPLQFCYFWLNLRKRHFSQKSVFLVHQLSHWTWFDLSRL